ncbi:MAG: pentapeptide repeat-containing protein [Pseudomonadota bacterium]
MSKNTYWYWKKNGKVTGPFAKGLIQQYILLGRIHANDLMSQNKESWRKVSTITDLIPDEVKYKGNTNYTERLKAAKRWADDRGDSREIKTDYKKRKNITHIGIHTLGLKALILFMIFLILGVGAAFYFTPQKTSGQINCQAKPVARIRLDGCALSGKSFANLDMQYASLKNVQMLNTNLSSTILSHSQMQYSQLDNSNLTDTKLDYADLTAASFSGVILHNTDLSYANLSYANLKGAKAKDIKLTGTVLSKTIWFNGKVCASSSIGRCLISKTEE